MKKLLSLSAFILFAGGISFAQSTATTTTDSKTSVEQAAPVVNAVEAQAPDAKCSSATGTHSCCSNKGSRTSAFTTPAATEITSTAVATEAVAAESAVTPVPAASCHEITIGVSAAKPEAESNTETPKE